jgi:2,4-dienoyl-CoA reductase-like NADH-dependent reductase (Old Yellow Enzyme family)
MRLTLEVHRSIRDRVGPDFPILWKLNTADYMDGGAEPDSYALAAERLAQAGVELIEMSGGMRDQVKLRATLRKEAGSREAYFYKAVPLFKKAAGATPLAMTGGIRSPGVMGRLIREGIDLIGMSRPLISDPAFPKKLLSSGYSRKSRCTSCNKCLYRIAREPLKCIAFDDFQKIINTL